MATGPLDTFLQGELAIRIFEESNDAFLVFDPQAQMIVEVNATAQRLTGLRRRQLLDRSIREVIGSDDDQNLATLLAETSESGFYQVRDGYYLSDGGELRVPVSITVSRLHVEPRPLALIVAHDTTRRRRLQKELRDLERQLEQNRQLASLGELVATLAHEIRQPLYAIANFATVAGTLLERGDVSRAMNVLKRISDESMRSSEVVAQIQTFVRSQQPETSTVNINELVQATLSYLRPEISHDAIRIETELSSDLPPGVCNFLQLQEVIINLVRNALEACARAGIEDARITIATAATPVYVLIEVADNGPGIVPEVRQRLFKPFTTTRPDGMGMGLAICRRMMGAVCGRLELRDSTDEGSVFVISVPRAGCVQSDTSF